MMSRDRYFEAKKQLELIRYALADQNLSAHRRTELQQHELALSAVVTRPWLPTDLRAWLSAGVGRPLRSIAVVASPAAVFASAECRNFASARELREGLEPRVRVQHRREAEGCTASKA
jgi:hypothetical protein